MSLRSITPCDEPDLNGRHVCPYADPQSEYVNCEYWCGAEEPDDPPEEFEFECEQRWEDKRVWRVFYWVGGKQREAFFTDHEDAELFAGQKGGVANKWRWDMKIEEMM